MSHDLIGLFSVLQAFSIKRVPSGVFFKSRSYVISLNSIFILTVYYDFRLALPVKNVTKTVILKMSQKEVSPTIEKSLKKSAHMWCDQAKSV